MASQQIYHIYFGHDGREYRELGHSSQAKSRVVNTAGKLCEIIGTPLTTLADRPFLLSYPDNATGYLYMVCCSPMNDFSNRSALFYHVLACSLDIAKKYGINAFSMYDAGNFVTNYQPGKDLDIIPISCDKQKFEPGTAPFVLMLSENDKPVVLKANEPGQLVRSLLTRETVNRLKWAEFAYKELPGFDLYVMANPDLDSQDYVVRDAKGKVLSNLDNLTVSDKPASNQSDSSAALTDKTNKKQDNNFISNFVTCAMILALTLLLSYTVVNVFNKIKTLEGQIAELNKRIGNQTDSPSGNTDVQPESNDLKNIHSELNRLNDRINDIEGRLSNNIKVLNNQITDIKNGYVSTITFEENKQGQSRQTPSGAHQPNKPVTRVLPPPPQQSTSYNSVTLDIRLVVNNEPQSFDVKIKGVPQTSIGKDENDWYRYQLPISNNKFSFSIGENLEKIECTCTITPVLIGYQCLLSGTAPGLSLDFSLVKTDPYHIYSAEIKSFSDNSGKTPHPKILYIGIEKIE